MTRNQLEYRAQNETRRANQAKEYETHRANLATEALKGRELDQDYYLGVRNAEETERANLARETETRRANMAREAETYRYNTLYLGEVNRANLAREMETRRSNLVSEAEIERSHRANEAISRQQIGLGYANVKLGYSNLAELSRSNQAREEETQRSNVARETEINRSNIARESETQRSNKAQENLKQQQISETVRYDRVKRGLEEQKLDLQHKEFVADTVIKGVNTGIKLFDSAFDNVGAILNYGGYLNEVSK